MLTDSEALKEICNFFNQSRDFNGIPASSMVANHNISWAELQVQLARLLISGQISLTFESYSQNPHIKRIPDLPLKVQLDGIKTEDIGGVCVYPAPNEIEKTVNLRPYDNRPYTRRLALAEPQLIPIFFDLHVLERYFSDPRYSCWFGDSEGHISLTDESYLSEQMTERDKVSLQSFGIGYDQNLNRVVVVFLRYLSDLSPEHQQAWKANEVLGPCKMNSDYERASIWGEWPEYYSVYEAFIQEQIEINKLSSLIGKPPLFKETYQEHHRPIAFSSMLRPTSQNLDAFVHLLDKMLSDNMDKRFFEGDIPLEEQIKRKDNTIEVRPLGTLILLERWLNKYYKNQAGKDVSREVIAPFKDIRAARQPTAHSIKPNEYNPSFPKRQDEILGRTKQGLTILRLIFSSHPKARAAAYEAPGWLDSNKIVFY